MIKYITFLLGALLFLGGCGSSSVNTDADLKEQKNSTTFKRESQSISKKKAKTKKNKEFIDIQKPLLDYSFDSCELKKRYDLVPAVINSGIKFDGKKFVKIPTLKNRFVKGFTFSAWVRFDKKAGEGKMWETIFSLGNDDRGKDYQDKHKSEIWLNRYYNENRLYFAFTNGDRDDLCADVKSVDEVLTPGKMQHIVATIDKNSYPHIYIDGKEIELTVAWHNEGGACELPSVTRDLCYIGKPNDEWMGFDDDGGTHDHKDNNLFVGVMDEVKFFEDTLSLNEIKSIYENEKNHLRYDGSVVEAIECNDDVITKPKPKPVPKPNPQPAPKPTPEPTNIDIKVDGDDSDWSGVEGINNSSDTLKVYIDSQYLYILINSQTIAKPRAIIFIDSDNNPLTGHQAAEWSKSGADYAIGVMDYTSGKAGKVYIAKTNDNRWEWDSETLGIVDKIAFQNGNIELKVKKSLFGMRDTLRIGVRLFNESGDAFSLPSKFYSYKRDLPINKIYNSAKERLMHTPATYISVSDSTRANSSHYKNYDIFKEISKALGDGVDSILQAEAGHTAKEWSSDNSVLNWKQTLREIPDDGRDTVVNISLGINDIREGASKDQLLSYLLGGVKKILAQKPNTLFVFTMPNPMIGIDSTPYIEAYRELAKDYLVIDTQYLFSSGDLSLYRSDDAIEYGKDIRIHLSKKGEDLISAEILKYLK